MQSTKKHEGKKPTLWMERLQIVPCKKSKKESRPVSEDLMEWLEGFEDPRDFIILFRNLLRKNPTFEKMLMEELTGWVRISFKY